MPPRNEIASALDRLKAEDTNSQIRLLAERIGQIASDTAVHRERDIAMSENFVKLEKAFDRIDIKFDRLKEQVDNIEREVEKANNKWRGGLAVILFAGTILGGVLAGWDKISKWIGIHP